MVSAQAARACGARACAGRRVTQQCHLRAAAQHNQHNGMVARRRVAVLRSRPGAAHTAVVAVALLMLLGLASPPSVTALRVHLPWAIRHWCDVVFNPHWPFAYQKEFTQVFEEKGLVASNHQHMGHVCVTRGARTKCHSCEVIQCGPDLDEDCNFQIQGVIWDNLPKNIPTITNTPWAVGVTVQHRYDYARAERVCVMLSGGDCTLHSTINFKHCAVRCFGATGFDQFKPQFHGWLKPKNRGNPQGAVRTLAGSGQVGYQDGPGDVAMFNNPQGLAVDHERNVYVADTLNHRIRMVDPTGVVTTVAGTGDIGPNAGGFMDGDALTVARFSTPTSITLYRDWRATGDDYGRIILLVSDTNNHRIRKIVGGMVTTLAGDQRGLADGVGTAARFDTPHGIAADHNGVLFVADTMNFLIRRVETDGTVTTLAGDTEPSSHELEGCPPPCLDGIPGSKDGPLREAQFYYPYDVAIGPNQTVIIADGDRIRRINMANDTLSEIQGVFSQNRVATIAGQLIEGEEDGIGPEASFNKPRGVFMSADSRMYVADTVACRVRRITQAVQVVQDIECANRGVDVVRPSGCSMYDDPTDGIDLKATPVSGNIFYNYEQYFRSYNNDQTYPEGRKVQPCVGSPEPDIGIQSNEETLGPYEGTGFKEQDKEQDLGDMTLLRFRCPPGCGSEAEFKMSEDLSTGVIGTDVYSDDSLVCASAIHAGIIPDTGGVFSVRLRRGYGPRAGRDWMGHNEDIVGTLRNGIQSDGLPGGAVVLRVFTVHDYPIATVEVQTIAGAPNAPLESNCAHLDGRPPQEMKFSRPSAVSMYINTTITDSEFLYVADSANNMIRTVTAVCSKICENGGECVREETCQCPFGWQGDDCTIPVCSETCKSLPNRVCTAPGECTCKPGYTGALCDRPMCVQDCGAHGLCEQPDTCICDSGWFDPNCTTPVCVMTCGNGGNCTAPDVCTCPERWQGPACRHPVCDQTCLHGGQCVAPNTCRCPPEWSGFDCSKPVCQQGFLRADPTPHEAPPGTARHDEWRLYSPCNISDWCDSTQGFDCRQFQRSYHTIQVPPWRDITGHKELPPQCLMMELEPTADTHFRYENELHTLTPYARITPRTPYQWGPTRYTNVWSSPNVSAPDRQVALVQWTNVSQGVYVCANNGNCTAPDTCVCADGWIGYDCRIPVCRQGWFEPEKRHETYLEAGKKKQGTYECSKRPVTIWENPRTVLGKFQDYVHDHPNFHSFYQNELMGWPDVHVRIPPRNDHTNEGWRRDGWWERTDEKWQKGLCWPRFNRTCSTLWREKDLRNNIKHPVENTDLAFGTNGRVTYDIWRATHQGRWFEEDGECVDYVVQGCYNNGTCVAPNTCVCAVGWEGDDCSVPICPASTRTIKDAPNINATLVGPREPFNRHDRTEVFEPTMLQYRECPNRGNCTLPQKCTCEKGWQGPNCTIPICAQECLNGGTCVLPDLCQCDQWAAKLFIDGRDVFKNGREIPVFQRDDGEQQFTGWTGYDCSTPICVQAEEWIPNTANAEDVISLVSTANDGKSFSAGCDPPSQHINPNRTRVSNDFLCGITAWYQGVYQESWTNLEGGKDPSTEGPGRFIRVNYPNFVKLSEKEWIRGPKIEGEGVYACFNKGSCIGPDTCDCADGWEGYDCNTPKCRHRNYFGTIVGCLNLGICGNKDECTCIQSPSMLHLVFPDESPGTTGYMGSDCSIAICNQGWYDEDCIMVPPVHTGVASGGEGCYRCANGGNCTAPDFCTCTEEWTGYDCRTPVCTATATFDIVVDLNTVDPARVQDFELDPCGENHNLFYNGATVGKGNCSAPNTCTCLCTERSWLDEDNHFVDLPWVDPLDRPLLPGFAFGTSDCVSGYMGFENEDGSYGSCHLKIMVPNFFERYSVTLIVVGSLTGFFGMIGYWVMKRRIEARTKLAKAERRRSRRSSEESQEQPSAFVAH